MPYALAVAGAIIAFLFWAYTGQVEKRVEAEVLVRVSQLAVEYQQKTAEQSQVHSDELSTIRANNRKQIENITNERDLFRARAESVAIEDPFSFGNNFERDIAIWMCAIEGGYSSGARESCRLRAAEAPIPEFSITLTITPEVAERYAELCEEGQRDFCNWAVTGFTVQGGFTFLNYTDRVLEYIYSQDAYSDTLLKIISDLKTPHDASEKPPD